jgi:hypothetical protein
MRRFPKIAIAIFLGTSFIQPAWSQDHARVAAVERAYVARCAPELSSQGMPPQRADAVCRCAVSGIIDAVKFGTPGERERYERLTQAYPNPNGSPVERQLYGLLRSCFGQQSAPLIDGDGQ